jgi:hypothetical protein
MEIYRLQIAVKPANSSEVVKNSCAINLAVYWSEVYAGRSGQVPLILKKWCSCLSGIEWQSGL